MGVSGRRVLGGFSYFHGPDTLPLAVHVSILSFHLFREILGDIHDIDEWPGEIITFADSLQPEGFHWETHHTMEVLNGQFDAGEFVYVVKEFLAIVLSNLQGHMLLSKLVYFGGVVHGVEVVLTRWII